MNVHIEIPVDIPESMTRPSRLRRMALVASFFAGLLAINALLPGAAVVPGPAAARVDRVEEDWELDVAEPDASRMGPQVTTTMRPTDLPHAPAFGFRLNQGEPADPGLSVTATWQETDRKVTIRPGPRGALATPGERVAWTQRLQLLDGRLCFEVREGRSTTWGAFGPGEGLDLELATPLADLSGYTPAASVADSGSGWMGDRVASLTLKQVRFYARDRLIRVEPGPGACRLPR